MQNYLNNLKKISLFDGIKEEEISAMITCLAGVKKSYKKEDIILWAGDEVNFVGVLLMGQVQIVKDDITGNRNILKEISQTGIFAETLSCAGLKKSPFTVIASQDCEILFISLQRIVNTCSSACRFHTRMIENILKSIAKENLFLSEKIDILSQRSIRGRLMAYFLSQSQKEGKMSFTIPFSRNEMADFICVDRSALSRELSKMQYEGLIEFEKNKFKISDLSKF
ncbi:MAG: Crp/Fnr family transcriptional regulator [Bacillota bacterium]